jgi:hypothetical protein
VPLRERRDSTPRPPAWQVGQGSATILQEAARRSPNSREFASASSSGFNDLARACPTAPPILGLSRRRLSRQPSKTALAAVSRRGSRRPCLPRQGGRGRDRDCPRQGRSERGTAGPHRTRPLLRGTGADVRDSSFCDRTGNPAGRASSAFTVGDFRCRFRGEKLYLFLRPLS